MGAGRKKVQTNLDWVWHCLFVKSVGCEGTVICLIRGTFHAFNNNSMFGRVAKHVPVFVLAFVAKNQEGVSIWGNWCRCEVVHIEVRRVLRAVDNAKHC
jgi:hypothetical protein